MVGSAHAGFMKTALILCAFERFGNRSGFGKKWPALPAAIKQQYIDEANAALKAALAAA